MPSRPRRGARRPGERARRPPRPGRDGIRVGHAGHRRPGPAGRAGRDHPRTPGRRPAPADHRAAGLVTGRRRRDGPARRARRGPLGAHRAGLRAGRDRRPGGRPRHPCGANGHRNRGGRRGPRHRAERRPAPAAARRDRRRPLGAAGRPGAGAAGADVRRLAGGPGRPRRVGRRLARRDAAARRRGHGAAGRDPHPRLELRRPAGPGDEHPGPGGQDRRRAAARRGPAPGPRRRPGHRPGRRRGPGAGPRSGRSERRRHGDRRAAHPGRSPAGRQHAVPGAGPRGVGGHRHGRGRRPAGPRAGGRRRADHPTGTDQPAGRSTRCRGSRCALAGGAGVPVAGRGEGMSVSDASAADGGLGRNAAVMAAGTAASRVLGVVRSSLLVAVIATNSFPGNSFNLANTLPNVIYMLIAGGVLNAVLVPQVVRAYRSAQGDIRTLATLFAFWCIPQVFFYGVYTLLGQVLNARGNFGPYMWAPVFNNIVAIAGLLAFLSAFGKYTEGGPADDLAAWDSGRVTLLAGSATLGVVVQALVLLIPLYRSGFRYRPRWDWRGAGLGTAGRVAGWAFAALVVGQVAIYIVYRVSVGAANITAAGGAADVAANNAYSNAFMIFMLPHSLVTVSLLTALFTRLSDHAAARDTGAVRTDFSYGLRT